MTTTEVQVNLRSWSFLFVSHLLNLRHSIILGPTGLTLQGFNLLPTMLVA